jgi:hypothetical protein
MEPIDNAPHLDRHSIGPMVPGLAKDEESGRISTRLARLPFARLGSATRDRSIVSGCTHLRPLEVSLARTVHENIDAPVPKRTWRCALTTRGECGRTKIQLNEKKTTTINRRSRECGIHEKEKDAEVLRSSPAIEGRSTGMRVTQYTKRNAPPLSILALGGFGLFVGCRVAATLLPGINRRSRLGCRKDRPRSSGAAATGNSRQVRVLTRERSVLASEWRRSEWGEGGL